MKNELEKTINAAIRESLQVVAPEARCEEKQPEQVNEAYVAQPKVYTQVSEFSSQRTKDAHDRFYKTYVEKLNRVSAQIDSAIHGESNSDSSQYRSLKLDEAHLLNAVYLHEMFFANCFDPHSEIFMDSKPYLRLQRDFGTFEDWQKDFIQCAMATREGWAVTGYNVFLKRFVNTIIDGHSINVQAGFIPVIVVDMWSHSYFRDYLDDKNSYIVAKMRELNWEVIEERFERCDKISGALK